MVLFLTVIYIINLPDAVTLGKAYNGGGPQSHEIVALGGRLAAAAAA